MRKRRFMGLKTISLITNSKPLLTGLRLVKTQKVRLLKVSEATSLMIFKSNFDPSLTILQTGVSVKEEEDRGMNMGDVPAIEDDIAGSSGTEMDGLERDAENQREEVDEENFSCGGSPIASIERDESSVRQHMLARFERLGRRVAVRLNGNSVDEADNVTDGAYDADLRFDNLWN